MRTPFYRLIRSPFAPVGKRAVGRKRFMISSEVPNVLLVKFVSHYFMTSKNIHLFHYQK